MFVKVIRSQHHNEAEHETKINDFLQSRVESDSKFETKTKEFVTSNTAMDGYYVVTVIFYNIKTHYDVLGT